MIITRIIQKISQAKRNMPTYTQTADITSGNFATICSGLSFPFQCHHMTTDTIE